MPLILKYGKNHDHYYYYYYYYYWTHIMTLSEMIYEKSRHLPEDKAQEVIDFIDFLLKKTEDSKPVDERLSVLTPEQREAYDCLDKIRIDWHGKPIADREEANARR